MGKGRKPHKVIKAKTDLPFEINFDFTIGKQAKYKDDKKVIKIIKEELKKQHKKRII